MSGQRLFAAVVTWTTIGLVFWGRPVWAALGGLVRGVVTVIDSDVSQRGCYSPFVWVACVAAFAIVGAIRGALSR